MRPHGSPIFQPVHLNTDRPAPAPSSAVRKSLNIVKGTPVEPPVLYGIKSSCLKIFESNGNMYVWD